MSEESKLLPCPFCGGEANFKSSICNGSAVKNHLGNVHCSNCYASTGGDLQTYEQAFKAWNTRPQEQKEYDRGFADGLTKAKEIYTDGR